MSTRNITRGSTLRVDALRASSAAIASLLVSLAACTPETVPPNTGVGQWVPPPPPRPIAIQAVPTVVPPTIEEAKRFLDQVEVDYRKLYVASSRASWVHANFITDDTEAMNAAADEALMEYTTRTIKAAARFDGMAMPPDMARQLKLLKLSADLPAPVDPKESAELAEIANWMTSAYGKGKYCKAPGKCQTLDDLSNVLAKSRNWDELLDAWKGWHAIGEEIKPKYVRYVELADKGSRETGFADLGAKWRAGYDMTPVEFEADADRLWNEVKPLYDDLHCYARAALRKKYGADKIPEKAPIPAHVLGNMWSQEWNNLYEMMTPYPKEAPIDATPGIKKKAAKDPKEMVRIAEGFFVSMGFDPLPESFWQRSLFTKPADREVVCHASAWDVVANNDLRIKICLEPKEEDLIVVHHELGHDYYFHSYYKLPILFQAGANDGFHEGIGDAIALAITPEYLKKIGLLASIPEGEKADINFLMKQALAKVSFLPFGLLIDKWRWDVFSGKTPPTQYNKAWWDLVLKYQGIAPPVARSEKEFDPGAKYHVAANVPYMRYFLAEVYQFQFYRALCKAAGHTGPLYKCSFFGSKAAGDRFKAMLALGASRPWQEAMAALTGESKGDATAILEYFAPLRKWLVEHNKSEKCGW